VTGDAGRCADTAAEAVRALNHATVFADGGLTGPGDVYDVLGSLATLAARLPQALSQLQAFLTREHTAGRVQIVDGQHVGDPAAAIADVDRWLTCATGSADLLREALEHAHATLTWAARADAQD
jgi:hypothetical protein